MNPTIVPNICVVTGSQEDMIAVFEPFFQLFVEVRDGSLGSSWNEFACATGNLSAVYDGRFEWSDGGE